ncbi:MAG: Crp/Fnr family transcriptional regulator [Reichenbachiella sp.]
MKEFLLQFELFQPQEVDDFIAQGKRVNLKKGDRFVQAGKVVDKVAFVISGIFRSYYYSSNSEEVTYCFSFQNDLIAGYSSFITGNPSSENIQALTTTEILVFSKESLDQLIASDHRWLQFAKMIAEDQYVRLEKRIFQLQKEFAINRYNELMANQPEYIQQIPLQYLASYLGISLRHLSRLRKQVSN